jgi:hypothetical protein
LQRRKVFFGGVHLGRRNDTLLKLTGWRDGVQGAVLWAVLWTGIQKKVERQGAKKDEQEGKQDFSRNHGFIISRTGGGVNCSDKILDKKGCFA